MTPDFQILKQIIEQRRTTKPPQMNGQLIPDDQIWELLSLADWAPTHGHTEPWRFLIYSGEKVNDFCATHARLYKAETAAASYHEAKELKLHHMGDQASHLIIAYMQRGNLPKIPALEEIAATSCAIQNLLLGATALGLASYWGSGGLAYHPAMKQHLDLREEDVILGFLYLGYADKAPQTGKRITPLEEKVLWM